MNEIRAAMRDVQSLSFTKAEHEAYQRIVEADLRVLRESRAELAGKASQSNLNVTFVIALIGALTGLTSVLLDLLTRATR
jgi:hypothetical protein